VTGLVLSADDIPTTTSARQRRHRHRAHDFRAASSSSRSMCVRGRSQDSLRGDGTPDYLECLSSGRSRAVLLGCQRVIAGCIPTVESFHGEQAQVWSRRSPMRPRRSPEAVVARGTSGCAMIRMGVMSCAMAPAGSARSWLLVAYHASFDRRGCGDPAPSISGIERNRNRSVSGRSRSRTKPGRRSHSTAVWLGIAADRWRKSRSNTP